MTENMEMILKLEERLKTLEGEKLDIAKKKAEELRKAEESTASLTKEDIERMVEDGTFESLPLIEQQFIAARTQNESYLGYRMLMQDLYENPDEVSLAI